ncbi:MAG: Uma2 family endonuclease [Planctomycetia bacterium]|nr:Uma2 family endonuclease [Planctomycetia bacterium]
MTHNAIPAVMEPEDLLRMPDGDHYELIDGKPKEKAMGAESDKVALRIGGILDQFCLRTKIGLAFGSQTGFKCFSGKPKLVRKPDASVVLTGRLPDDKWPKGDIPLAPDLAVEVVSPNDTYEEVAVKIAEFKSANVKLIWVISPETRTVLIRRLDGSCAEVGESGTLSGEDVLPGFTCAVAELFV